MLDQHVYSQTAEVMNSGGGYYEAMDSALREVYGPSSTPRAFRLPTVFVLWSTLGLDDRGIWLLFIAAAGVAGIIAQRLSAVAVVGPFVTLYLLLIGMLPGDGWTAQYATTELWAVPWFLGSILAWRRQRYGWAAVAALAAFSVRELAAALLVAGFLAAWRRHVALWPWLTALTVAAFGYLGHVLAVSPFLVADGAETPLLGTGSVAAIGRIAGFGLPGGAATGFVLLTVVVLHVARSEDFGFFAGCAALPLLGILADRPYWGIIVVPLFVIWTVEFVVRTGERQGPMPHDDVDDHAEDNSLSFVVDLVELEQVDPWTARSTPDKSPHMSNRREG